MTKSIALIFDMDGVLVDVSNSYRKAIIETAERFLQARGITATFTNADVQRIKNRGNASNDWVVTQKLIKTVYDGPDALLGDVGQDEIKTIFQALYLGSGLFERTYRIKALFQSEGYIRDERWLLPLETLEALSRRFPLAIVSGRPRAELEYALLIAGAKAYFHVTVAMEDVKSGKPNPEGILRALRQLNAAGGYYFGDTTDDVIAAKNAGITPVGVLPPNISNSAALMQILLGNGAVAVLESITDIYTVIKCQ